MASADGADCLTSPPIIARIAEQILVRLGLKPPVDVDCAIENFADLVELSWPFDCDGVADLRGDRAKVFIKSDAPHRRKRFTKAHELGHVVIGWHVGTVGCHIDPLDNGDGGSLKRLQEQEANQFASHLLIPDSLIGPLGRGYVPVPEILETLEIAEVSAAAGIIALRRVLLPGYIFVVPGVDSWICSSGTQVHARNIAELKSAAVNHGVSCHQGRSIRWFQLAEAGHVELTHSDPSETRHILVSILQRLRPNEDCDSLVRSIYGVIGGLLSKYKVQDPAQVIGILRYRFASHDLYIDLARDPEFDVFLQRRAIEITESRKTG
ncbi:ImmA/IrrE family metallo-endopeptidase [Thermomonospora cellulosilytica]|uniref:IrrE N-terminal-like domain-containing protein n=1 Tax=Thermomonospora cellulosilytica TaxID=1411118 RepID=A0A7W3MW75_9ACTN|nr:ImmA/IrrE family metallo-endopeptidase [Thermomonospora cellulosilytica]MBA9003039.1 hypothetical protein [Thermomonospora cellulosilytica]